MKQKLSFLGKAWTAGQIKVGLLKGSGLFFPNSSGGGSVKKGHSADTV